MNKMHKISGNNFHGKYAITLRGPEHGFVLSKRQARKYFDALCGIADCKCGGGYGDGPDQESAHIVEIDYDRYMLIPSGQDVPIF